LFQNIIDLIYPVRCPVCGEIVIPKGNRICEPCKRKLQYIREPRCKKCSKPIELEESEFCSDCQRKDYHFTKGYSVWVYDDVMKRSIADFKYHKKKEYALFYVEELLRIYGEAILQYAPDVIMPIPIHNSKFRQRGYNQAELIANMVGKELNIKVISDLLVRNRKTIPQKQLSDKERLRNLKKAFEFNGTVAEKHGKVINKLLIVDDIFTTGSTIEACANVLKSNGINDICFITLCIGKNF